MVDWKRLWYIIFGGKEMVTTHLTKTEFKKLNKINQKALLAKFGIDFKKDDKEDELYQKYEAYWAIKETTPSGVVDVVVSEGVTNTTAQITIDSTQNSTSYTYNVLECPSCKGSLKHVKNSDYQCTKCLKGFSGWPPPKG